MILRDATFYFLVMFANQIVLFLFLFLAPVCDVREIGWGRVVLISHSGTAAAHPRHVRSLFLVMFSE